MVIDDRGTGIPVALIAFTPKKDAVAAHASYDTAILEDLLERWRQGMGTNEKGESFQIAVGNTDNDTRERSALQKTWPNILLILCMFHIWQSWRNALTKYLACIPKGPARTSTRSRLGRFLMTLLKDISDYALAQVLYNDEVRYFEALGSAPSNDLNKLISKGGLRFLAYFKDYLRLESYWVSWSPAGVIRAAEVLGIDPSEVPRTTNHIESFNGRVKGQFFAPYQNSGRLPRLDAWVLLYITQVLPNIFAQYDQRRAFRQYQQQMQFAIPAPSTPPPHTQQLESKSPQIDPLPLTPPPSPGTLSGDVATKLLNQLEDDEVGSSSDTEDGDDPGPATPFDLSVFPTLPSCLRDTSPPPNVQVEDGDSDISMLDIALESSLIICDLPTDVAMEIRVPSNQLALVDYDSESDESFSNIFLPPDLVQPPPPPPSTSNSPPNNNEAIACQEVLMAEDELVRKLRRFMEVTTPSTHGRILPAHMSDRVQARLASDSPTHSIILEDMELDPPNPQTAPEAVLLEAQKKEKRKPSYGIR